MTVPPPGTGQRPDEPGSSGGDQVPPSPYTAVPQGAPYGPDTTISLHAVQDAPDVEPRLSGADQAAIDALPAGSALLVVQRGPNAGARFLLDAERTTAGRRQDSDIFLDDVTVSRKHAEFVRRDGEFYVRDVGSLNGTYLAKDRIDAEALLHGGDEVQIGKYRLVFHPSPRSS